MLRPAIIQNIRKQIEISGNPGACICLGAGTNARALRKLNDEFGFFKRIIPVEHPRYIVQYNYKERHTYIDKYLQILEEAGS